MAGSGYPSPMGDAPGMPSCDRQTARYGFGPAGTPVRVEPDPVPLLARAVLVLGDLLGVSRYAKQGSTVRSLDMDSVYRSQAIDALNPLGGVTPEATIEKAKQQKVPVKLAARGYVDPQLVRSHRGIGETMSVAQDIGFIP